MITSEVGKGQMPIQATDSIGVHGVVAIVRKLNNYLTEETSRIQSNLPVDYASSSEKKSRFLHELSRAGHQVDLENLEPSVSKELSVLKSALIENETILKAHILAVGDVSKIMIDFLKDNESDGTYEALPGKGWD